MTNTTHDRVLREIARAINLIEKYEEGEDNPGLKQRALETLTALQRDVVKPAIKQLMLPIECNTLNKPLRPACLTEIADVFRAVSQNDSGQTEINPTALYHALCDLEKVLKKYAADKMSDTLKFKEYFAEYRIDL